MSFKSWQQHSRLLSAERLVNTYISSLLMDEHVIRTNWQRAPHIRFHLWLRLVGNISVKQIFVGKWQFVECKIFHLKHGEVWWTLGKQGVIPLLYWVTPPPAPWAWLRSSSQLCQGSKAYCYKPVSPKALRAPALIKAQLYTREPGKPGFC